MTPARLPASVVVSLGLHLAALAAFGLLMRGAPKQAARMVEGVDLLVQAPRPRTAAVPAAKPLSTMDFLKLALPAAPRAAAPAQLALKVPERKTAPAEAPKLEESARKDLGPKLRALDLSNRPAEAERLDVKVARREAAATLAALPRLEDVGRHRVRNLPQALALEERRREAVAAGAPGLTLALPTRRQALAAAKALQEEAASESEPPRRGLAALLPEKPILMEARPQPVMAPRLEKPVPAAARAPRREAAQAEAAPKKGVEIEGPLADRKVAAYSVPAFPEWARRQGVLEADVSIRFTVGEDGAVLSDMRVTSSSGYGRIDKLAMESLRSWRFVPKLGAGVEWGVITFRFVLE